jgi:oxygen-dependent protoporphyrinogen oxidase
MPALVIGGGISGLACAYRLTQLGADVKLLEQSPRVGGVVQSRACDGFQFDLGPQSFLSNETALRLVSELDLRDRMVQANPRAPRYVQLDGKLSPVPMSPPALIKTSLISRGTKLRLLSEPFRRSRPPADDESVAAFARRKFGADLLDNLLAPFVSGVYAGDPERISFRSAFPSAHQWELDHGSVIRGAMKSKPPKGTPRPVLTSFHGGLQTLMDVLAQSLAGLVETGVEVCSVSKSPAGFDLQTRANGQMAQRNASVVVLATPSYASSKLLAALAPAASECLARIEHAPVAVANFGYRRQQVQHNLEGFGFLVPRTQGLRTLGTIWGSSLFPGRAPEGMVSLTSFLGGATDRALLDLADDHILKTAATENARVLGITGEPMVACLQRYTHAIPQYNLGHGPLLARAHDDLARIPGLFLTGNYLQGPAVGTCIETAFATAQQVYKTLQ